MPTSYKNLGRRVVVVGVSASGKSTFARELANKLDLPVTHVDAFMWQPGWNYIGKEETVGKLKELSAKEEWIIEGYIEKDARATLFERADSIIYLDYPRIVASWRYIKRWWNHRKAPRPELPGSPEKFSFKFLRLVWRKGEVWKLLPLLKEPVNQKKLITLTSPKQTKGFLEGCMYEKTLVSKEQITALELIAELFKNNNITYQVSGGLAAIAYGATRPLYDIDIDIHKQDVEKVRSLLQQYIVEDWNNELEGPEDNFDLWMMTLTVGGVTVDISQIEESRVRAKGGEWTAISETIQPEMRVVASVELPIQDKQSLIVYKKLVARDTDLEDVRQISTVE